MKKINYLILFAILVLALGGIAGCGKDNTNPGGGGGNNTSSGNATLPSGAAGGFYAIGLSLVETFAPDDTLVTYSSTAWLDSYASTSHVNTLSVNGNALTDTIPFFNTHSPWYIDVSSGNDDFSSNNATWSVSGNSSLGIPAFNYNDVTPFPVISWFNFPDQVNLNTTFTATFTNLTANNGIICSLIGNTNTVRKTLAANATSVSFTSAELHSVATSGGAISLQIMPITYVSQVYSGKTYYFVKENAYQKTSFAM